MIRELSPFVSYKIWGGQNLKNWKQLVSQAEAAPIGETWEVSTHRDGISKFKETNESLTTIADLKYLVKLIDTDDVLSIQVHPDDLYAMKFENQKGKTECWLILQADVGAGIYLGLKKGIRKKELQSALDNKENVGHLLNFIEVKAGDFFLVPSGAIHAIGKGVSLVEVQQSSGVTYRVWDWNRLDNGSPRELHVKKSFDVLIDNEEKNSLDYFQYRSGLFHTHSKILELAQVSDFNLKLITLEMNESLEIILKTNSCSILILSGETFINSKVHGKKYNAFYIHNENCLQLKSEKRCQLLLIE